MLLLMLAFPRWLAPLTANHKPGSESGNKHTVLFSYVTYENEVEDTNAAVLMVDSNGGKDTPA